MQSEKNKEQTMKKKVIMVVLVIVMIASFAGTALADPDSHQSWEEPYHYDVDCGDFNVILDGMLRISVNYFPADRRNPNRYKWQYQYNGTISNTASGETYRDSSTYNGVRLWTGERTLQGVVYHTTVPGGGVIMLVAGHIVWDSNGDVSFVAGPNMYEMWEDPGEIALLCENMAGY
jgi:hypothetical protein